MLDSMRDAVWVVYVGCGATLLIDLWAIVRRRWLGIPSLNYAYVGRWFAYLFRGRLRHDPISATAPVRGEVAMGWGVHYVTGMVFAAALLAVVGSEWRLAPTFLPALLVGLATVAAPFLILQPALGAGIASSRAPRPAIARVQSLITHAMFGFGLYLASVLVALLNLVPKSH